MIDIDKRLEFLISKAVVDADDNFLKIGGSVNSYVSDFLLPSIKKFGIKLEIDLEHEET